MNDELLTIDETAARLRVHKNTILNWLKAGIFPNSIHVKSVVRIPSSDIEALKNQHREAI